MYIKKNFFFFNLEFSRNILVWYSICQGANVFRSSYRLPKRYQISKAASIHASFFKIHVFVSILHQQFKFAGRWKNVPNVPYFFFFLPEGIVILILFFICVILENVVTLVTKLFPSAIHSWVLFFVLHEQYSKVGSLLYVGH